MTGFLDRALVRPTDNIGREHNAEQANYIFTRTKTKRFSKSFLISSNNAFNASGHTVFNCNSVSQVFNVLGFSQCLTGF